MKLSSKLITGSLIIFGFVLSLYSTFLDFSIHNGIYSEGIYCSINEFVDCSGVYLSEYSRIFDISKSLLGGIYFIILLVNFGFVIKLADESRFDIFLLIVALGAMFAVYNLILSLFIIRKICVVCSLLQGINIFLFIYLTIERKRLFSDTLTIKFGRYLYSQVLFSGLLLFLGLFIQKNITSDTLHPDKKDDGNLDRFFASNQIRFNFTEQVPVLGNEKAAVEIVIISDFECVFCRDAANICKEMYTRFPNNVRLVYIHFPIDKKANPYAPNGSHMHAGLAAKTAICLSQKASFWKYHDEFFKHQDEFNREYFYEYLDQYDLSECIDRRETNALLNYHMDLAMMTGIQVTPTIFINGRRLKHWSDKKFFQKIINFEISQSKSVNVDKESGYAVIESKPLVNPVHFGQTFRTDRFGVIRDTP